MCANGGGGCGLRPPQPPLSFYAVQAFFQEHCIINKTCFARIIVIEPVQVPSCRQSICKRGSYVPPNPRFLLSCARPRQVSSCQQKQNPYEPFQNPRQRGCVCKWGGGCAAPNPTLSVYAVQACFQEHRNISKTGFTRTTVIELFIPIMLAVHLPTAGLRPPQSRTSLKLYKLTTSIILQQKRTHMAPVRTCDKDVVCANGGGCAPPPTPPLFFLRRADLLSRTSYHQPELFQ